MTFEGVLREKLILNSISRCFSYDLFDDILICTRNESYFGNFWNNYSAEM